MNRDEFIRHYRHEVEGWLLDAAMSGRGGAELSCWLRAMRQKIETKLGDMHTALQPKPAANGQPAQPTGARK